MITLASDFGSPYPAAMKGVILQQSNARLVDVSHDLPRQDVRAAAFWLREVLPYFPPAVHLAVVDPGVGTDREAIVLRAGDHALVGPDNGVLVPVASELATGGGFEVYTIEDPEPESATFHGRDVFAPAAAAIHEAGVDAFHEDDAFAEAADIVDMHFPEPTVDDGVATGSVLVVDGFGNVVTNVPGDYVADSQGETVTVNGESVTVGRTYASVETDSRLVTVGSHGNVELAVNQGRADEAFALAAEDEVRIEL